MLMRRRDCPVPTMAEASSSAELSFESGRIDALLRAAAASLSQAGVPSPAADAEHLLAHVRGIELNQLRHARLLGESIDEGERVAYVEIVGRRAQRIPLQHLTGQAHFYGLELAVGPGVFVPRPETEILVSLAVQDVDAAWAHGRSVTRVVDLCTGSGAIALAVMSERGRDQPEVSGSRLEVGAVELSEDAHGYARANVDSTGLAVDLRLGAAQEAFRDWEGTVDVVTSNPPYIPPDAVPIDVEVREHDPEIALYGGGHDGLDVPREVADRAWGLLRPGGVLLMEHADAQGESLPAVLRERGWMKVTDHVDLSGRPRVTRAVRP